MKGQKKDKVIVVGGGVVGLTTATLLLRTCPDLKVNLHIQFTGQKKCHQNVKRFNPLLKLFSPDPLSTVQCIIFTWNGMEILELVLFWFYLQN